MANVENINVNGTEYRIKDDEYIEFDFTYENQTIASNSAQNYQPTNAIPSGYDMVGVISSGSTSGGIVSGFYSNGIVQLVNTSSVSMTTKPVFNVRLHKN